MWHTQALVLDNVILIKENIEVDVAWSLVDDLLSTHGVFDILELVQEC